MPSLSVDDYHVGWICALHSEMTAAKAMLDERHDMVSTQNSRDKNSYALGRIHDHNVVIACLPSGVDGTSAATAVAMDLSRTFTAVRFGLMVGIGGGVPNLEKDRDIRLGDVVVSLPTSTNGGVIQYDKGKSREDQFERKGMLNMPPSVLLKAVNNLRSEHEMVDSQIPQYLATMLKRHPKMSRTGYVFPEHEIDILRCTHCHKSTLSCKRCHEGAVKRVPRESNDPEIHYGVVASGNQVIKSAVERDQIRDKCDGAICVEMEAAGLMNDFPCLVVRGICDYADASKNDTWHNYAAATAAAFAKELLLYVSTEETCHEKSVQEVIGKSSTVVCQRPGVFEPLTDERIDVLESYHGPLMNASAIYLVHEFPALPFTIDCAGTNVMLDLLEKHVDNTQSYFRHQTEHNRQQQTNYQDDKKRDCHRAFHTSMYVDYKNINPDPVPGTCRWVLDNDQFRKWRDSSFDDLLWISADPGCGKSVLAKHIIDSQLPLNNETIEDVPNNLLPSLTLPDVVCYFFFKDNEAQNSLAGALCAVLHQLFTQRPQLIRHALLAYKRDGGQLQQNVSRLWQILLDATSDPGAGPVLCVLDAVDECRESDRLKLINFLCAFHSKSTTEQSNQRKFLLTSRPYDDIQEGFSQIPLSLPSIRIRGEDMNDDLRKEIDLVVVARISDLAQKRHLAPDLRESLEQKLLAMENRTYLWLYLALEDIEDTLRSSVRRPHIGLFSNLPASIEEAYEKLLQRGVRRKMTKDARLILKIIVGARRALSVEEMALAFDIAVATPPPVCLTDLTRNVDEFEERIRQCCGLFVFLNHRKLYLIHQTAKEFLLSRGDVWLPNSTVWRHSLHSIEIEREMARICVRFLGLSDYENLGQVQRTEYGYSEDEILDYASDTDTPVDSLFVFAVKHWTEYVRGAATLTDDDTREAILRLYDTTKNRFAFLVSVGYFNFNRFATSPPAIMDAMEFAVFNGHITCVKYFLSRPHLARKIALARSLYRAADLGYTDIVQLLIEAGADVNLRPHVDQAEFTILERACVSGNEKIVQILTEAGADPAAQDSLGTNALILASETGNEAVIRVLLEFGADPHYRDAYGANAAAHAALFGRKNIVRLLQEAPGKYKSRKASDHTHTQAHQGPKQLPPNLDSVPNKFDSTSSEFTDHIVTKGLLDLPIERIRERTEEPQMNPPQTPTILGDHFSQRVYGEPLSE